MTNTTSRRLRFTSLALVVLCLSAGFSSAQISIGGDLGLGVGVSLITSLSGALNIVADATLAVSGYVDTFVCSGASLALNSGVQLACGSMQLESGAVAMADSTASLTVEKSCAVSGASNTISGGMLVASSTNVSVASGSQLLVKSCSIAPAAFQLASNAYMQLSSCAVTKASAIRGTATSTVEVTGATVCHAPTTVEGVARVTVSGTLDHEAAYTSNCAHTVTGAHIINAANTCSYGSLAYGSAASLTMKAHPVNGYTATRVAGALTCGGSLHLQSGSYVPPQQVVLHSCGSVAGKFSSVTCDSATIKGQIHYTANSVVWYPYATGPCTSCTQVY
jgi:hypothetical protein